MVAINGFDGSLEVGELKRLLKEVGRVNRREEGSSQGDLAGHVKGKGALGRGVFKGGLVRRAGARGTAHPVVRDIVDTDEALPSCSLVTVKD